MKKIKFIGVILLLSMSLAGCHISDEKTEEPDLLNVGASSISLLPTVDGSRDYLKNAPGWPAAADVDPNNPGVFIADWDQGQINVGNGNSDASWVHDDIRVTAIAIERYGHQVILVSANTYMHLAQDIDKIIEIAKEDMPAEWQNAEILIAATHNHHGPETGFSVNREWYAMAAEQFSLAIVEAINAVEPAITKVATGMHGYGAWDQRDPQINDDRLNVMTFDSIETGNAIAIMVQWASHPETTLGFTPAPDTVMCLASEENCDAKDRYFTGDFPGVLQTRIKESRGGELLYFNGAIGALVGPLHAPAWVVDDEHPITGDGRTIPEGAVALMQGCDDKFKCLSFLKTESIGNELYLAVDKLIKEAESFEITELTVKTETFYTRMTNLGFRVLFAQNEIGWQYRETFTCDMVLSDETCVEVQGENVDDPFLTPAFGSQIIKGDFIKTRTVRVDFGDVGMLFIPGELPAELVTGLPADFITAPHETYYSSQDKNAVGVDYKIPGYLLSLIDEEITFTVGLGMDELGYGIPVSDYRILCSDVVEIITGLSCAELKTMGAINEEHWVSGNLCKAIIDDDEAILDELGALAPIVGQACRYGQLLDKVDGHYEETQSVGWDLVRDLWHATQKLYQD